MMGVVLVSLLIPVVFWNAEVVSGRWKVGGSDEEGGV
jgi:hypothetical protein